MSRKCIIVLLTVCFTFSYINAQKINIKRRRYKPQFVTKVIFLKYANPADLQVILSRALGPRAIIKSIVYNDGRKALIITADAFQFSNGDGDTSLEETIKTLDRPGKIVPEHAFIYYPKARSAKDIQFFIQHTFFDNSADKNNVTVDRALNVVIVKASKTQEQLIRKALFWYDIIPKCYRIHYSIFKMYKHDLVSFNINYSKWKKEHQKCYNKEKKNTVTIAFKYKWCPAYFYFLADNHQCVKVVSGSCLLNSNGQYSHQSTPSNIVKITHLSQMKQNIKIALSLKFNQSKGKYDISVNLKAKKYYIFELLSQTGNLQTLGTSQFSKANKTVEYVILLYATEVSDIKKSKALISK